MKGGKVQDSCHSCRPLKRGAKDNACTSIAEEFGVPRSLVQPIFVNDETGHSFFVRVQIGENVLEFHRDPQDYA